MNTFCKLLQFVSPKEVTSHVETVVEEETTVVEEETTAVEKSDLEKKSVEDETQWLEVTRKKIAAAQAAILQREITKIGSLFEAQARLGTSCVITIDLDKFRNDTIVKLKAVGFTFGPELIEKFGRRACNQRTMCTVSLPADMSLFEGTQFVTWRRWLCSVKKIYRDARRALVQQQYRNIKARFDIKASYGESIVIVDESECFKNTRIMLRHRLNCTITRENQKCTIKLFV